MKSIKVFAIFNLLLVVLFCAEPQPTKGQSPASFSPPSEIGIQMYWLDENGARRVDGGGSYVLCAPGDTRWGCTAFCDELGYPCESSQTRSYPYTTNPVTASIESDYLLDVVPQEMATYYHPTAIQAQAIAARTYAYYHINQGSTINNSTQFQVFVPYKFESLTPTTDPNNPTAPCASSNLNNNQQIVCSAVAPRYYITPAPAGGFRVPAKTEYFSDIRNRTVAGGETYLMAVDNSISSACDADDFGHGRGMSQEGASRWVRSHQCSYEGAPTLPGNPAGGPWSVRWARAEQILFHYYPGASIRDANDPNFWPLPYYRWNPLSINWETPDNQPPMVEHEGSYPVTVLVQNTGQIEWDRTPDRFWGLSYHWAKAGSGQIDSSNRAWIAQTVPTGDPPYTFTLTINDTPNWGPGVYTLEFDMVFSDTTRRYWFSSGGQPNWPTYDVSICVDGLCRPPVFLPVVLKNY